jgi:hypothetical protein
MSEIQIRTSLHFRFSRKHRQRFEQVLLGPH